MEKVRVRYAPSPTGFLHIGNARTAMFNYLFAKHYNGDFVLRIEDTDIERNVEGGEESQMHYLRWLGMEPDESPYKPGNCGPYRQMERLDIYKEVTDELLAKGLAYKCFCTSEELAEIKEEQESNGVAPMYNRKCASLSAAEVAEKEAAGLPYVIRLRVPANKQYAWKDMIRGTISVESKDIGDWVIVKSNGIPTYNYAVVIDDHTMNISHVFRGEEHISNTPKQLMVFDMMGWEAPQYGHMTLIVNDQHKKLSKRDNSIMQFVSQYDEAGYLPEAMFNYMALLGWSPEGTQEIFTKEELIEQFSEKRLSKAPSMFDKNKLAWVNGQYIKKMDPDACVELAMPFLKKGHDCSMHSDEWLSALIKLYQEQMCYGEEIVALSDIFFKAELTLDEAAQEVMTWETQDAVMGEFKNQMEVISDAEWNPEKIQEAIKATQKATGIKGKPLYMGLRVAITTEVHGPDLKDAIYLIGKEETIKRLTR